MTLYDMMLNLVGQPPTEYGEVVLYILTGFLALFVIYMLLNLILTIFRFMWGNL